MTRPSRPQLFPPASRGCGALYARGQLSPRRELTEPLQESSHG